MAPDIDEIWAIVTKEYEGLREQMLKQLEALDAWYGDFNIRLSDTSTEGRKTA